MNEDTRKKHVIPAVFVATDIGGGIRGVVASCTCKDCILEHRRLLANGGRVITRDMDNYRRMVQKWSER